MEFNNRAIFSGRASQTKKAIKDFLNFRTMFKHSQDTCFKRARDRFPFFLLPGYRFFYDQEKDSVEKPGRKRYN